MFSVTGGIEKGCRSTGKALNEICKDQNIPFRINCVHDSSDEQTEKYFPRKIFHGFSGRKKLFALRSALEGMRSSVVVLIHINLLPVASLIKFFSPKTKLVLFAHGIEVWYPLSKRKTKMLHKVDLFFPVSECTKQRMMASHKLDESKFLIANTCLDPFLPDSEVKGKKDYLLKRYNFSKNDKVLFTLARLSFGERYKGYDKVISCLKNLVKEMPDLKYLIVGKYDESEKQRIEQLIQESKLENCVILAGFVPDEELVDHFDLSDVYIMPSTMEGLGLVFMEAAYYGKPVIAGNKDGSVDATGNGEFGYLVDPDSGEEITKAIKTVLANKEQYTPNRKKVLEKFGFVPYKEKLRKGIYSLINLN